MSENLFEKLHEYSQSGIYPFCMPGHKRNFAPEFCASPYDIDITEVEGFDDLQRCEGILGDIQKDFARIYGCESVFISVNGSSGGNIAAVASLPDGGSVLAAANCHRSVFNAVRLNRRKVVLIEPQPMLHGLKGGISPQMAREFFEKYSDVRALVVTSPTYEGFTSDISALSSVAHEFGAYLIVDEAHGAHLPFISSSYFPVSALYQGADIVIQSLHKTLPALNQTSLVFVPDNPLLAARVKECLNMVMTTSPSYILMASAQEAVCWAASHAEKFEEYEMRLKALREELKGLENICVVDKSIAGNYNIVGLDPGKLVFAATSEEMPFSGRRLFYRLLEKHGLQLEKYEDGFALAMTSVMDTEEGFCRLRDALFEEDKEL